MLGQIANMIADQLLLRGEVGGGRAQYINTTSLIHVQVTRRHERRYQSI